ncbi:MAG TPA: SOS response-associated peptidase, partial [Gemmatimonadota bacterium]|nr:SOS response-associated peptidase [Gemmatimonadota bacterium]
DALSPGLGLGPRFNIAPTQDILVVRPSQGSDGGRELARARWGLLPGWVDDPGDFPTLINARSESARTKPSFRDAFRSRRCLVPADGFYEWKKTGSGKQPWLVRRRDDRLFAFAGLWDRWERGDRRVDSATILTTSPSELLAFLHDRMPVILPEARWSAWMDPDLPAAEAEDLLVPYGGDDLEAYEVSRHVNSPTHDDPACVRPADDGTEAAGR